MVAAVWQLDAWETFLCTLIYYPLISAHIGLWHYRRSIFDRMATALPFWWMTHNRPSKSEMEVHRPSPRVIRVRAEQGRIVDNLPSALVKLYKLYGCQATKLSGRDARKLTRRRSHAAVWWFPVHNTIRKLHHDGNLISFRRVRYRRGKRNFVTV